MPNPSVWVHTIIVHFDTGTHAEFLADDITSLQVIRQVLRITAVPDPQLRDALTRLPAQRQLVTAVEFEYAAGDGFDYRTVVRAGDVGEPDAADHIRFRRPQAVSVYPKWPEIIAAQDIRPGETFAVEGHQPFNAAAMSKDLQAGWHKSDCTWYYPF